MGVTEFLKGYLPQANDDSFDREVLKGIYKTKVLTLRPEANQAKEIDRYRVELEVTEVVKGNGAPGRRFYKSYFKDNEESMRKMLDDFFTAGITFDTASDAAFETSFEGAIGKEAVIRAYGWKPEKTQDGTPIPEEERKERQMMVFKSASELKGGTGSKRASSVPF